MAGRRSPHNTPGSQELRRSCSLPLASLLLPLLLLNSCHRVPVCCDLDPRLAEMSWWRGDAILRGWWPSDAVLQDRESAYLRGGWRADDVLLGGAVTDEMLGVGKQRGRAVQRDEMSIGYNEIEVGLGSINVGMALFYRRCCCGGCPRGCSHSSLSSLGSFFPPDGSACCCGPLNGKPQAMVKVSWVCR